jgi:ABC-type antimicrobial peptide transport system permease subunit
MAPPVCPANARQQSFYLFIAILVKIPFGVLAAMKNEKVKIEKSFN